MICQTGVLFWVIRYVPDKPKLTHDLFFTFSNVVHLGLNLLIHLFIFLTMSILISHFVSFERVNS